MVKPSQFEGDIGLFCAIGCGDCSLCPLVLTFGLNYMANNSLTYDFRAFTMANPQKTRHYLSQYYAPAPQEEAQFRKVNLVARAVYPVAGLKTFATMQVRIVGITDKGALLQSSMIEHLSDHFYLCLGEREIFITCAKRNIHDGGMVVGFSERESPAFVDALARIPFPLSTLKRMRGACAPAIEQRITRRHHN
ncbi:hypothetical protein [Rhizobium sp. SL86]|uniref:hypothetical protein n=1 Tax=Rhizobium sp. SL86 TaxID=2995148 RepID=UPI00227581CD|nr:hypothetical protein [Rhizobium sp. SL86]MCY1668041.1 hypothetical protein [Rhizobium sp. SL86]